MMIEYKDFYYEVRFILGRFNRYVTDEDIQEAWEENYDARDYAQQQLIELGDHFG